MTGVLAAGLMSAEEALAQTPVFVQWPLTRNATDSVQVRRPTTGITASAGTFKRLVLSSGTPNATTPAVAPYSSNGQAFATTNTGANGSTNTPGGPRRAFYEQFAITNSGTAALRVDSLLLSASTLNSANGQLALSYSTSGFTTDSIDFAGGKGPAGVLPATANGSFGTATSSQPSPAPIALPNFSTVTTPQTNTYRMAFVNTGAGLSLAAGQTLTVRLYFRVGSNTDGRYFVLKNVVLKSTQAVLASRSPLADNTLNIFPNPAQSQLTVAHAPASRTAQLHLYNATGERVLTQDVHLNSLGTSISLEGLAHGLYLVEYTDSDHRTTARVVKE